LEKILVTGSNGPLGFALQEISKGISNSKSEIHFTTSKSLNLLDKSKVRDFFLDMKPTAVIHLAAKSGNAALNKVYPVDMFQENFEMTSNVLSVAKDSDVKRIIMASSTAAYPTPRLIPADESLFHSGPPSQIDYPYAYAKRLMDPLAEMYRTQYGLDICVPIINGILGPKMNFRKGESLMLAGLIRRFLEYKEFGIGDGYIVQGDGTPIREYTSSADLALLLLKLLDAPVIPKLINIGNSQGYTVREYAQMVAQSLEIDLAQITFTEEPDFSKVTYNQLTDNSLLKAILKFEYREIPLAIDETIDWFRKNYSWAAV
jgi:nucleoside-diphosphate-sugar epimerase